MTSVVLACCASGCITVDGTLASDGTASLSVHYAVPPGATEASQRLLLRSPGITVESLAIDVDRMLSATLGVAEVGAIGENPVFRNATVTQAAQGDDQVRTILESKVPKMRADTTVAGPRIRLTLPGDVVEAPPSAVIEGEHVEWSFALTG